MTDPANERHDDTPAALRLNDQLGPAPTQAEIDRLMKRCQIGVGGRHALEQAHDIMAACYGTLGRQQIEIDRLRWALTDVLKVATSWHLFNTTTIDGDPSSTVLRLRAAEAVLRGTNVEFSGAPVGHLSNHPAGGTSAGTQG